MEILNKYGSQYTKSSVKQGIEIHKSYKMNDVFEGVRQKEYGAIHGNRPDFVDFSKHHIFELKPYNPRGVRSGIKQLERYKRVFEANDGNRWETFLDFY